MRTAIAMAGLALAAGVAAAGAGPWHLSTRVAAVRLGVRVVGSTAQLRKALGVDADRGALVLEVEANGPAERAHLQAGDVITRVAGRPVSNAGDMLDAVAEKKPGDTVSVDYVRDRRAETTAVSLAEGHGLRMGRWSFGVPGMPPDINQQLRRFRDRVERQLREFEERLHRLEKGTEGEPSRT